MKKALAAVGIVIMIFSVLVCCSDIDRLSYDKDELSTASLIKKSNDMAELARQKKSAIIEGYPNIGIVMPTLDNGGWIALFMGTIKGVYKNKIGMVAFSANNDVSLQNDIIEDLISKKIDGIVFVPTDSGELSKMVKKANAAKIPIVSMDRSTDSGKLDGLVESDNLQFGVVAAKKMIQIANGRDLKIFNLQGDLATSAGIERNEGFINEISKYSNCKIVQEKSGYWRADKGFSAVLEALQNHPEINVIYVPSDAYTQGVIAALEDLGRLKPISDDKHIMLITVDGQPIGLDNIRKDYVDIDIGQDLCKMGELVIDLVVKTIKKERIENQYIKLPPKIIDRNNVNDLDLWGNQFRQ